MTFLGRRSLLAAILVLATASLTAAQERRMVPVTVEGRVVRLEMRVYLPATPDPAPTFVFNHGSTGRGVDPSRFTRSPSAPALAKFFVERGWAVVMPARRGRGGSDGLYDEGFARDRAHGYTCDSSLALPGADRALADIEGAMAAIIAMPFVDRDRVVIGGESRGGILSVAYAGRHPEQVKGVINFVGGWVGAGCPTATEVNQELMKRGARYPGEMLWLYGDGDSFYPLDHSRANFAVFRDAGGRGAFHEFAPPPGTNGHRIASHPDLWTAVLEAYLTRLGLPATPR